MTVTKEAKLPGILGNFPIPNRVTNKEFIVLIIVILYNSSNDIYD